MAIIKERYDIENRSSLAGMLPLRAPLSIFIEPTNLCNFGCKFCPTGDPSLIKSVDKKRGFIDTALFSKIIEDVRSFGEPIKKLHLNKDGESLMHPEFFDLVGIASRSNCFESIECITNRSLLSPSLNTALVESGLDRLKISLYGMNDLAYKNFVRRKIDFKDLILNIKDLYLKSRGKVEIFVKITRQNLLENDAQRFFEIFDPISDRVFIEESVENWPEFKVSNDLAEKKGAEKTVYGKDAPKNKIACAMPFYSLSINCDGSVSACCVDWSNSIIVGNVGQNSLKDIWMSKELLDFRLMMLNGERFKHPICGDCKNPDYVSPDSIDEHLLDLKAKYLAS